MSMNRREFIIVGGAGTIGALGTIGCRNGGSAPASQGVTTPETHLTVLFDGLIAMVTSNSGTDFVMVDGDATGMGTHAPRLVAPQGSVGAGSLPPAGSTPDGKVFWDLKNHRLTLSGPTGGTTRAGGRQSDEVEKPNPNTPNSHKDVSWVAQMAKIPAAGSGKINPVCLADDPRPAKVASRVRFNGGDISSKFSPKFLKTVWQIGPAGTPPPFKQALSELSIFSRIPPGPVSFRLDPFDSGLPRPADIKLVPTNGVNLEIEIANLPSPPVGCTSSQETANLAHFAAYYQLLATPSTSSPIPSCTGLPNCPICPASGEIIYCPPAEFQAP